MSLLYAAEEPVSLMSAAGEQCVATVCIWRALCHKRLYFFAKYIYEHSLIAQYRDQIVVINVVKRLL